MVRLHVDIDDEHAGWNRDEINHCEEGYAACSLMRLGFTTRIDAHGLSLLWPKLEPWPDEGEEYWPCADRKCSACPLHYHNIQKAMLGLPPL